MVPKKSTTNYKKLDSYSVLIVSKYFETKDDFINVISVNSKFKETTEKLRYNPIPIKSLKLFPKIQTQHLYSRKDKKIDVKQIIKYEYWYEITVKEYLKCTKSNIKCHYVKYAPKNKLEMLKEIPDGVTSIVKNCFYINALITSINLPSSLQSLGENCFSGCRSLRSINFPSLLTSLGDECFQGCLLLTSINLPPLLRSLNSGCFEFCRSLKSINLPNTIVSLGTYCFGYCVSLESINLPSLLTSLGDYCFYECIRLTSVNITPNLKIGKECFGKCCKLKKKPKNTK